MKLFICYTEGVNSLKGECFILVCTVAYVSGGLFRAGCFSFDGYAASASPIEIELLLGRELHCSDLQKILEFAQSSHLRRLEDEIGETLQVSFRYASGFLIFTASNNFLD